MSGPVAVALGAVLVLTTSPAHASLAPDAPGFQVPFACGERWEGSTYPSHSPSSFSVDWNRNGNDLGHVISATASGVVSSVTDLGNTSYGLYVIVDHGRGWTSLHAHLSKALVAPGQIVDQGQPIALLGTSGGSTGPHLHYEQRLDGTDQHAVFDGSRFEYDSWLRSRNCTDVPVAGDWGGDRRSEVGVFARRAKGAKLRELLPTGPQSARIGRASDSPLIGDWDGNGRSDPGVWRSQTRRFALTSADGSVRRITFGHVGDVAVSGDWDGNGRFDVGVFRPNKGLFVLRGKKDRTRRISLGGAGTWPVTGDWDGDGRYEVGVFDPAAKEFTLALRRSPARALATDETDAQSLAPTKTVRFGKRRSLPVIGDWNGDARSDLGVWSPVSGVFTQRFSARRIEQIRFGRRR